MYRQPNRGFIWRGPCDAVPAMCGNVNEVAGLQLHRLNVVVKLQKRGASQQEHPLGLILVVPKAIRRSVPERNDPLDADIPSFDQPRYNFVWEIRRKVRKEVAACAHLSVLGVNKRGRFVYREAI